MFLQKYPACMDKNSPLDTLIILVTFCLQSSILQVFLSLKLDYPNQHNLHELDLILILITQGDSSCIYELKTASITFGFFLYFILILCFTPSNYSADRSE